MKNDALRGDWDATKQEMIRRTEMAMGDLRQELKEDMLQLKKDFSCQLELQAANTIALDEDGVQPLKSQVAKLEKKAEDADSKASNLFDGVDAQFVEHESSYRLMEDQFRKFEPRFKQAIKGCEEQLDEIRSKLAVVQQNRTMLETKLYSLEEFAVQCSNMHRQLENKLSAVQHIVYKDNPGAAEDVEEKSRAELAAHKKKKSLEPFRVVAHHPGSVSSSRKL